MRVPHLLILIALIAMPPSLALGAPADLEAARKLTGEVCDAMARKDFKPLLELIRNGDIKSQLIKRMPAGYPTDPEIREKIAAAFMETVVSAIPQQIGSSAAEAERFMPPAREENGSLVVLVRFDSRIERKTQFTVFQLFRYRASPEGLRLVNMETPLAGQDIVTATASLMPPHWPQSPQDKAKVIRENAVINAILRGSHSEAEKAAREVLKESPDDLGFRLALADALTSLKNYEDAGALLRDMLARGQAVLYAHDQLAALALEEQRYDEAVAHLRAVLDGLGEDDWTLARLANAQRLAGKTAEAKASLERALKIAPFSRPALEERARFRIHADDLDGAAADLRSVKEHHGLGVLALLKDPDFSKLVLMEKYGDILDRPSAPKTP